MYNFALYTEWPVAPVTAFNFCVLGKDPFGARFDALASKTLQGKYTLFKVDGGNDVSVMKQLGATVLPTFMVYKNGKLSWKKEGIATLEELKSALTQ